METIYYILMVIFGLFVFIYDIEDEDPYKQAVLNFMIKTLSLIAIGGGILQIALYSMTHTMEKLFYSFLN